MQEQNETEQKLKNFFNSLSEEDKLKIDSYVLENRKLISENIKLKK